ncbi:hypothetical protein [Micromonospora sp. NPDC005299]|uniref:hypothetical protein n=1 Tax=Micromonospora sp. NPDC005299 TaxID=3364231 RepID=UPI0036C20587
MSTAPKPPTKMLLGATWLSAGITIGIWSVTFVGSFVFSGIPANRMPYYIGAGLLAMAATSYLGTQYVVQKHRRDAWWEGFAAGDEPGGEVIQLGDFRRDGRDTRGFGTGSTS